MIFVNFKTYSLGTGEAAVRLAKICQEVASATSIEITPVVQVVDLFRVHQEVGEHLWVQHVDGIGYGPHTGWTLPAAIKDAGAKGTLLNHSEHKLEPEQLKNSIGYSKQIGLKIMVCADSLPEVKHLLNFQPDLIAYEPPELIGGKISVATVNPDLIQKAAHYCSTILPLVVGAGIHSEADISKSLELGAKGVLVSSDILAATDPKKELESLAQGFKK